MTLTHTIHAMLLAGAAFGLCALAGCTKRAVVENANKAEELLPVPDKVIVEKAHDGGVFATPEAAVHDAKHDVYLVANINGGPADKDNNGFISRVSPDGEILSLKWIESGKNGVTLHAPKGLGIAGNVLWVADITSLRVFDLASGAHVRSVHVPNSGFLNAVAPVNETTCYVTDSGWTPGTQGVYRVTGTQVELLATNPRPNLNGILRTQDGNLIVLEFGPGKRLLHMDSETGEIRRARDLGFSGLDGIVEWRGAHYVSSWETSAIHRLDRDGTPKIFEGLTSPAAIGLDTKRGRLLVPLFKENKLVLLKLPR